MYEPMEQNADIDIYNTYCNMKSLPANNARSSYLVEVKIVKANLCLWMGSKSLLRRIAGLADDLTPTSVSAYKAQNLFYTVQLIPILFQYDKMLQ